MGWVTRWLGVLALLVAIVPGAARASAPRKPIVGVLYFDYEGEDPQLRSMRKGLAQMLITDMSGEDDYDVVERLRLQEVLQELKLAESSAIDQSSAVKVGKVLQANRLVLGGYFQFGSMFRIDARIVEVETSKTVCSVGWTGSPDELLGMQRKLAQQLAAAVLSDGGNCESPGEATAKPSTQGLEKLPQKVLSDFGKALDAADEGNKDAARQHLDAVLKEEPKFTLALDEMQRLMK